MTLLGGGCIVVGFSERRWTLFGWGILLAVLAIALMFPPKLNGATLGSA